MTTDLASLLNIVLRSSAVYVFMIVAFRLFGKRELSQLSIADLVLIVLISNAVQNAMVGENTTLLGGITAATVLFALNMLLGFLMFRYKSVRKIIQSEPVTLLHHGEIIQQNMHKVLMTEEELMAAIREHGLENIKEVSLAVMETDGNISVISVKDNQLKRTQHKRKRTHKTLLDI